jgi:pyruvate,water dikinase
MSEETLWTRAYGDEYWADVTSPLFFSLLGEYLTEYVNHEGARITGYWETADKDLLRFHKGHIYFNAEVLEYVFTFNPKLSRTKELLNHFPEKDQERIANAKTKISRRIWAEIKTVTICSMRIRYLKTPETNYSMPSREMPRSH